MKQLIEQATEFLKGKIRSTPVEFSPELSTLLGQSIYLKLECFQTTGSFKLRGAFFYLSTLNEKERKLGVATCSAGNHGPGMAYAAGELQIPCTVFVPKSVDQAKYDHLPTSGCAALKLSIEQGRPMTYMPPVDTFAGGLEGGLGEMCFEILKTRVDAIALIKEDELKSAALPLPSMPICIEEIPTRHKSPLNLKPLKITQQRQSVFSFHTVRKNREHQ